MECCISYRLIDLLLPSTQYILRLYLIFFRVTILNADGEKFMQTFPTPLFNVTHFMDSGLLWMQVRAKGPNGYSNTIHIEINFNEEEPKTDLREEVSLSLLPILCLLAGSLAVLLSIIAGILECSRRKYTVSNEVTHISFSNNLDINPSKIYFIL